MFHPLYLTIINKRSHYVRQTIPPSLTSRVYTLYSISTNQAIPIAQPNLVFFIKAVSIRAKNNQSSFKKNQSTEVNPQSWTQHLLFIYEEEH